jgi:hypothetical protein
MAALDMHNAPRCQHVHYSGKACKAPARRGRNYCIFHQAAHLDSGGCVLPIVEDLHSYQLAVIRIARALADDAIDARKATALLYALQLAGWKLGDFCDERRDIEDPDAALARKMQAHFLARHMKVKLPVPTEQELADIISEIRVEQPAEPRDDIAIFPQPQLAPDGPEMCADIPDPVGTSAAGPVRAVDAVPQGRFASSPGRSPGNNATNADPVPEGRTDTPDGAGCPTLTDVGRVGTPNSGSPIPADPLKGPSLAEILLDRLKIVESERGEFPGDHIPKPDASAASSSPEVP